MRDPFVPLPVLVAGWLRGEAGAEDVSIEAQVLPRDATCHECVGTGTRLISRAERSADPVALLVVADGAATHTARAPGTFHPGAEAFDREVATAFATGDSATLARSRARPVRGPVGRRPRGLAGPGRPDE